MVPVDLFMHNLHAKPRVSRKLEENVRSEATSRDRDSTVNVYWYMLNNDKVEQICFTCQMQIANVWFSY